MAQGLQPDGTVDLTGANVGGIHHGPNMRNFRLCNAFVQTLDLRGTSIRLDFFEGAKFGSLTIDEKTTAYSAEGTKLRGCLLVVPAQHKGQPCYELQYDQPD